MKISLHAEFDSPEEYSAFVDMLTARPVAIRSFNERAFGGPKGDLIPPLPTEAELIARINSEIEKGGNP